MDLAVVLVSGGMDSCVTAAIANLSSRMAFLHVRYGQRTEERELKAFHDIGDYYGVRERLVADISYLREIGGSALTDRTIDVPVDGVDTSTIPVTYVPFRNAHLLSIAVSWAEVIGAGKVFIGAVEEDSSGYPDCRESFYRAFQRAVDEGTRPETRIEIVTPLIRMKKWEIVKKGMELKAPFHLTWSCYRDGSIACGVCDSCRLRLKGFKEAGFRDPIPYERYPFPEGSGSCLSREGS